MDSNTKKTSGRSSSEVAINFCSINICGMSDRSRFVLDKYCFEKSIDILAVQESTTVDKANLDLKFMDCISDTNNALNRGSSLYVNTRKFSISPLPQVSRVSKNIDTAWGLVCGKGFRYVIGSVYLKLNYNNAVNDFIKMLESAKKQASQFKAKGVIIFGDYNARNRLWGNQVDNSYGKELADKLNFQDYTIISSDDPTFLASNGNSNIDFLICSNNLEPMFGNLSTDPVVELFSGAPTRGHVPITTTMKINCSGTPAPPPKLKIDIDTMEWEGWSDNIETSLGNEISELINKSADEQWKIIDNAIHTATSKFANYKKSSVHSKPYWTKDLSEASKLLRNAKKNYLKRNTLTNKATMDLAKEYFDTIRKTECQNFILKKTKDLNVAQCKKFWKEFNRMFTTKSDNKVEPLQTDDGNLTTDSGQMEDILFDSFFAGKHLKEKGSDFDDAFYEHVNRIHNDILENNGEHDIGQQHSMYKQSNDTLSSEISAEELLFFLKQYETSDKSFDNHEFHPCMLTHLGETARKCILILLNTCLTTGQWVWDTADVIFLKKDGKKDYVNSGSYRPISITSYIGKVFEKLIASRLESFFNDTGVEDEHQEGFTKKRNTVRYLNHLDNDIRDELKKKYTVICLFIDFEKAFDSVWKKGLMKKLADVGIKSNVWRLLDSFLFNRKIRLIFNDYSGLIRACREFGLPQGSALSPILFKFYIRDLAEDIVDGKVIKLFKFADDGTLRVIGTTTAECLENLETVCGSLHRWSSTWRMIINCNPSKTELICFGTAEKNPELIPQTFKLGNYTLKFVEKTKVLGLVMDQKLNYIDHGKEVNRKILGRWVAICKYTNRNWGFKQHVIVRLIEVLIATCIHYAGIVWINNRSIQEVEKVWYRMLKSSIGAVFNVKQSLSEAILGVLPISISNRMNSTKHLLKLNIFSSECDPLKSFVNTHLSNNNYSLLTNKVKDAIQFLEWKSKHNPDSFNKKDMSIIKTSYLEKFSELSSKACSYTKTQIRKYSESLWQTSMDCQFQLEGFSDSPKVSVSKLKFPPKTTREAETITLSLFYPNNLMNEFLYRYNNTTYNSPNCCCGHGCQNSQHILLHCRHIDAEKRSRMSEFLEVNSTHSDDTYGGNAFLITWSRIPTFFSLCMEIMNEASSFLRSEIEL